jgi:hypothetical protein
LNTSVTTVREMGLVSCFTDVQFPNVDKLFDAQGNILDPAFESRIRRTYAELIWMTKTLKWGRDHLPRAK